MWPALIAVLTILFWSLVAIVFATRGGTAAAAVAVVLFLAATATIYTVLKHREDPRGPDR